MGRQSRSHSRRPRDDDDDRRGSRSEYRSRRYNEDDTDSRRKRRRSRSPTPERERSRDRHRKRKDKERSRSQDRKEKKKKRETSEERKARKEEKKRIKEEEERRQVAELSVYSATDNPFHDVNLGQQFHWHKKVEKERKQGLTYAESQSKDAIRRQDAKDELERLNRRRKEREIEMKLREEEELRMSRLQESAQMAEWLEKDGEFQLEQERRRATIRIKEKRAKAVDFLALNLKYVNPPVENDDSPQEEDDAGLEIDLDEPYNIFNNLSKDQVHELHDDIERYLALESNETNVDFWTNMMVVCKDHLDKLSVGERMGVEAAAAVEGDITRLLVGKSYEQLASLQRQVQAKLTSGEPIDTDYWESLLKKLLVWKSKARLKSLHEVVVRNRLEQLRKKQRDEALQAQEELLAGVARSAKRATADKPLEVAAAEDVVSAEEVEPYDRSMSPAPINIMRLPAEERQIPIISAAEDLRNILQLRRSVAASRFVPKTVQETVVEPTVEDPSTNADMASEALYRAEAEKDLEEEEELFNLEEDLPNPTSYNWEDKYRPRKPRYFNRVHTGYEWNKYNQTHYDTDNPPPKVVQGYKFNIFYPDLIDKSKAPTYKIVKEPGNDETVILQFSAGPPYEDIAFRIVNREWEFSHKRGFRSSFDRGCLSLWFNFRRNSEAHIALMVPTLSSHVDNVLDSIANLTIDTSRKAQKRDHDPRHLTNPHAASTNVAGSVSRPSYPAFDHDDHLSLLADTILRDPSHGFDVSIPRGAPLAPMPSGRESSPEEDIQSQDSGLPSPEDPDKTPTRSSFVRGPTSPMEEGPSLRFPTEWIAHYLIEGLLDGDYQDPAARPALFQVHHYLVAFFQAHCQYYELRVATSFLALCYLEMLFDKIYMSHLRFKSPCHKAQAVFSIFCVFYVVASKWNDDDARIHVRTLTRTKAFAQDHHHAKALENQALQVLFHNMTINTSMWVGWLRYLGETNNDRITGNELTFPLECIKPCQAAILALLQRTSECPPGSFSRPIDEGALAALVKALCLDLVKVRRVDNP